MNTRRAPEQRPGAPDLDCPRDGERHDEKDDANQQGPENHDVALEDGGKRPAPRSTRADTNPGADWLDDGRVGRLQQIRAP